MQPISLNAQVDSDAHVAFGGELWLGWKFLKLKQKLMYFTLDALINQNPQLT